jgi:cell shape-determining protein MreC
MSESILNKVKIVFYTILIVIILFIIGSYYYKPQYIDVQIDRYKAQRDSLQRGVDSLKIDRISLFKVTDSLKTENRVLKDRLDQIARNLTQITYKYERSRIDLRYLNDDGQLSYFAEQVSQ